LITAMFPNNAKTQKAMICKPFIEKMRAMATVMGLARSLSFWDRQFASKFSLDSPNG